MPTTTPSWYANLANRWDHFHHVGVVPTRPVAGSGTSMAAVGAARGQRGLTWTVDSGAGLHMANKHEVKDAGFSLELVDDYFVQGV